MTKWTATGVVGAATVAVVVVAGGYVANRVAAANYVSPPAFAVAEAHPEFGEGVPADLQAARLIDGGRLQVVASGGHCAALSSVDTAETATAVTITVKVAGTPGDCMANVVPWFVNVVLDAPLGNRSLVDTATGRTLQVADCTVTPAPTRGVCVAAPLTP